MGRGAMGVVRPGRGSIRPRPRIWRSELGGNGGRSATMKACRSFDRRPTASAERAEIGRRRVLLNAAQVRRDAGVTAENDGRTRHGRAQDVSQRNDGVRGRGRWLPRGTGSTIRMTPPHSEQAGKTAAVVAPRSGTGASSLSPAVDVASIFSSARQRANLSVDGRWRDNRSVECDGSRRARRAAGSVG